MMSLRRAATCLLLTSVALLSACSGGSVKNTLGISRAAPDEFRVVPRPALSVPPQFNLRPPGVVGENAASASAASKEAEALMLGTSEKGDTFTIKKPEPGKTPLMSTKEKNSMTGAEAQFLSNAGANNADPKVRAALVQDSVGKDMLDEDESESSWWNPFPDLTKKKEPTVNPGEEAKRIKTNKQAGKKVNDGEVPATTPTDRGVLGHILGD